jgi:hypothetical protein
VESALEGLPEMASTVEKLRFATNVLALSTEPSHFATFYDFWLFPGESSALTLIKVPSVAHVLLDTMAMEGHV